MDTCVYEGERFCLVAFFCPCSASVLERAEVDPEFLPLSLNEEHLRWLIAFIKTTTPVERIQMLLQLELAGMDETTVTLS